MNNQIPETKEELIAGILRMDPSYIEMDIDLNKYTIEQLKIHYERKLNAPTLAKRKASGGWYNNFTPSTRKTNVQETEETDSQGYYIPKAQRKPKQESVALTGFDALKKE